MIRRLPSGEYRLYSRKIDPTTGKRRNLGTVPTREGAAKDERALQYFKRRDPYSRCSIRKSPSLQSTVRRPRNKEIPASTRNTTNRIFATPVLTGVFDSQVLTVGCP